jgi:uncharacterized membrane protein (UPF0127 family)
VYRWLTAVAAVALLGAGGSKESVTVAAPKATLTLEVAKNEIQREYGLMNRTAIAPHTGMVFVFDTDQMQYFWMKDTLVPLDMVFIGGDGTVRKVYAAVPVLPPGIADNQIPLESAPAKYVIELASGEAAQDGLAAGVRLDLSGLPPASR